MNIMIIDPIGGISGDMLLGSLIHLGCPLAHLEEIYRFMPVGSFAIHTSSRLVNGIESLDLRFEIGHDHSHRTFMQIREELLERLPVAVRKTAVKIFTVLAQAEAAVHGVPVDEVHFHEVGATDSILDIVGIAAALDWLKVDALYARAVPLGTGTTKSRHGTIPVPAPATVKLLEGCTVRFTGIGAELTTPTGAAVIRALAEKAAPPSDVVVRAVGYGCGDRQIDGWPNLCRSILCEVRPDETGQTCYMVEADVDDMSPEEWEAATQRIFAAGALDVSMTPRIMKKGRPGVGIKAVCSSESLDTVVSAVLEHTTSIGARYYALSRRVLERREFTVETKYGKVAIKEVVSPAGRKRCKAEYRDLHEISLALGIPVSEVRAEVDRVMGQEETGRDS